MWRRRPVPRAALTLAVGLLAAGIATWRFLGPQLHNLTLASGPEGFSSDRLVCGKTFSKQFTKPGTYQFFCELHPVGMIERVVVRP
jgi:plastocyanin